MTVPGEWYLSVNLLMDTACLAAAARLLGLRVSRPRLLAAAALGTGLSMAALACWGARAGVYAALPIALLMALIAFGARGCPRGAVGLMFGGLATAGIAGYLNRLGLNAWGAALCCLPPAGFALRLLLRARSRAGERADVRLLFDSGGVTLDGLVDTGNLLRDPVTALPVVVAPYGALRAHLPDGLSCRDLGTLPRGFRLIRVRTAAGAQMLMCFRPRALYIRRDRVWRTADAVVAVSPDMRDGRALLPPDL